MTSTLTQWAKYYVDINIYQPFIFQPLKTMKFFFQFVNYKLHWVPFTVRKKMQKKLLAYKWVLVATELISIAVNDFDFDAKKSAHCRRMYVVTELIVSRTSV